MLQHEFQIAKSIGAWLIATGSNASQTRFVVDLHLVVIAAPRRCALDLPGEDPSETDLTQYVF